MNDYFLDPLEKAFGKNLDIYGNNVLKNPSVFLTFPVYKQFNMTILYSHLYQMYN